MTPTFLKEIIFNFSENIVTVKIKMFILFLPNFAPLINIASLFYFTENIVNLSLKMGVKKHSVSQLCRKRTRFLSFSLC